MKPGFQRDVVIAYWLLFGEFEIGDNDPPEPSPPAADPTSEAPRPDGSGVGPK